MCYENRTCKNNVIINMLCIVNDFQKDVNCICVILIKFYRNVMERLLSKWKKIAFPLISSKLFVERKKNLWLLNVNNVCKNPKLDKLLKCTVFYLVIVKLQITILKK